MKLTSLFNRYSYAPVASTGSCSTTTSTTSTSTSTTSTTQAPTSTTTSTSTTTTLAPIAVNLGYDERAVATEDTTTFDLQLIEEVLKTVPLQNVDFGQQAQNEAGTTIGVTQTKILSNSGTTITGTTSMTQIMNDLIDATKVYTDTTVSVLENINSSYLIGGLRMFTKDRKYITGQFGEYASNMSDNVQTSIFGKSDSLQSKIDQVFADALSDVDNGSSPLLVGFTGNTRNVNNRDLRAYKKNLKSLITAKKTNFSAIMETKLNDLVTKEQLLIRVVDKINFVQTETDGFKRGGTPILYGLTATTQVNETSTGAADTLAELVNDYKTVANNLNTFYTNLGTYNIMNADWDNSQSFSFLFPSIRSLNNLTPFSVSTSVISS